MNRIKRVCATLASAIAGGPAMAVTGDFPRRARVPRGVPDACRDDTLSARGVGVKNSTVPEIDPCDSFTGRAGASGAALP